MTELSRYTLEPLWDDGELVLSRAVPEGSLRRCLVVAPASEQLASSSLARLEHAYALRDQIEAGWRRGPAPSSTITVGRRSSSTIPVASCWRDSWDARGS